MMGSGVCTPYAGVDTYMCQMCGSGWHCKSSGVINENKIAVRVCVPSLARTSVSEQAFSVMKLFMAEGS